MPPRVERFTVPGSEGVALRTLHWGEPGRPSLVLLHGGGANAHWWEHLAPAFADRFHVVALDFRGHGESSWPAAPYAGAFSDDLDALLAHLGQEDALLMGHSMGARIALERAGRVPGHRALVLLDVGWRVPRATGRSARRALTLRSSYASREAAVQRFRFVPVAARAPEALRRAIAERSVLPTPEGRWSFAFDPRWFALPHRELPPLARVTCPVLVVRGAESEILPAASARSLVAELPDARLVEVPDAGHHVHIDRPDAVEAAVGEFLDTALDAVA